MSDDFLETIWAQYAVETEEHIDSIESLLVKADVESLNSDEVSGLFRAFHSLKGLSGVMELSALESVAHRSEDLLGRVRDGTAVLDKSRVDLLLRALDAIKILCEKAVTERIDGEKPVALLQELERAFKAIHQGNLLSDTAIAPVISAAEPVQESTRKPLPSSPLPQVLAQSKPAEGNTAHAALPVTDSENRHGVFLRLIRNGLPVLEKLASTMATQQDGAELLKVSQGVGQPLSWMLKGSNSLGYAGLSRRLEDILASLPASEWVSEVGVESMVDVMVPFLLDLKTLGEANGVDLGGESLAKALSGKLQKRLLKHLTQVEGLLQTLASSANKDDHEINALLAAWFMRIHGYLATLYPFSQIDIPLLLVDAFARSGRLQRGLDSEVMAMTLDAVRLMRNLPGSHNPQPLQQADLKSADEALQHRIRQHLRTLEASTHRVFDSSDAAPIDFSADTLRHFLDSLNIPKELGQLLLPDQTRELMQLIQSGALAYLIKTHLESSAEMTTTFLAWVADNGQVLTNRTLIEDDQSWYEMLFVSKLPRADIEQALRNIDKGAGHLGLLCALGHELNQPNLPSTASAESVTALSALAQIQAKTTENSVPIEKSAKPATGNAASNVIRVPGEMLDHFMNQIGEMVQVRGQLSHIIGDPRVREGMQRLRLHQEDPKNAVQGLMVDLQKLTEILDDQLHRLQETDALIQGTLSRFQESVMGLRVVPVELVFKRFPRMVRDLALAQGKNIRLELIGQEVKIDKAMVESLADPLLHMVRNSADHGVEAPEARRKAGKADEAIIRIQAEQQGSRIIIRVFDDGKGIDPEQVRRKAVERGLVKEVDSLQMSKEDILGFIFRPSFSTADAVTETSGRGVGMDVVWTSVIRLGGTIHLDSEVGRGTTLTLQMPLSAAVQEVLLVKSAQQILAIPGRYVAELLDIEAEAYQTVKGRTAILLRGNFLPIVQLEELLGYPCTKTQPPRCVMVLSDGQRTLGVAVQGFVGRQELFTKDIHPRLAALPGVGGASILGDGRVVLILDTAALFRLAENLKSPHRVPLNA